MSTGSSTPAPKETAEKRMASNPFFDNIRQNSEALSLERSMANLSPVDLPDVNDNILALLPPFLASILRLPPMERAHRLARQFYELEVAERERLEGTLAWHANVQGTHLENLDDHAFKKFGISAGVELGSLNRFKNIFPYDHARVKLSRFESGATDYINASHVRLATSPRHFIASQGPLHSTFPDFWQMCDQENVGVIIMLTNLHEGGREKCSRYWMPQPSSEWDVEVQGGCSEDEVVAGAGGAGGFFAPASAPASQLKEDDATTVRRAITLHRKTDPLEKRRKIRHIQYRAWPDFDIPAKATDVVELVREVELAQRNHLIEIGWQGGDEPPILAHCSAGVGRTGVFVMVSTMLEKLARDRRARRQAQDQQMSMDVDERMDIDGPIASPLPSPASISSSDTASISAGLSASTLEPSPVSSISSTTSSVTSTSKHDPSTTLAAHASLPALESAEPVFAGVNEMREQRMSMVANYRQYCCVHECILTGALEEIAEELAVGQYA